MHVLAQPFWLHKVGNAPEEYEDAVWPEQLTDKEGKLFRFAVADGATETSFSDVWASILVRAYGQGQLNDRNLPKSLPRLQKEWRTSVSLRAQPLPWYAEEKLRDGAFSSILGLTIGPTTADSGKSGRWKAVAIGDSCLFQVRDDHLITAFPLENAQQFNNRPVLVSSNPTGNGRVAADISNTSGEWQPHDIFYLMTDALACWFLRRQAEEGSAIVCLSDIETQALFSQFVQEEREQLDPLGRPCLRNDDVTMLRVKLF